MLHAQDILSCAYQTVSHASDVQRSACVRSFSKSEASTFAGIAACAACYDPASKNAVVRLSTDLQCQNVGK
jgi:hypothetical protein